jgi:hypothetical protein
VSAGPDTPAKCFRGMMLLNWLTNEHYSSHPEISSLSTSGPMSDSDRNASANPGTETLSSLHKPPLQDSRAHRGGTYEHVHSLHHAHEQSSTLQGAHTVASRLLAVVLVGSGCCRRKLCVGDYR